MATSPDDADALFGDPPPEPATAAPPTPFGAALEGAEARRETRVKVSWPARVQLANGRVIELRVRDLSDNGVGLLSSTALPSSAELKFAMGVPALNDPSRITPVTGILRNAYTVVQGRDIYCGGAWVELPPESRELISSWIRKLRR